MPRRKQKLSHEDVVAEPPKKRGRPRKHRPEVPEDSQDVSNMRKTCAHQCGFCQHRVVGYEDYAAHIVAEHIVALKLCPKCSRAFTDDDEFEAHKACHQRRGHQSMFSCAHCSMHFKTPRRLETHEFEKHEAVAPGVVLARYIAYLSSKLHITFPVFARKLHLRGKHFCRMCDYGSEDLPKYIAHLKKCTSKKYVCECATIFKKKSSLIKHMIRVPNCIDTDFVSLLPPKTKKSQCDTCNKLFEVNEIRSHMSSCKVFSCTRCDLTFRDLGDFNQHHLESHDSSLKISMCPYCRMEFISLSMLDRHIKQHEKYNCLECGNKYRTPKPLLAHLKKNHPDIEPYKCCFCDVTFKEGFDFKTHITSHQEKGYVNFDDNFYITFSTEPAKKPAEASSSKIDDIKKVPEANKELEEINNSAEDENNKSQENEEHFISLNMFVEEEPKENEANNKETNENDVIEGLDTTKDTKGNTSLEQDKETCAEDMESSIEKAVIQNNRFGRKDNTDTENDNNATDTEKEIKKNAGGKKKRSKTRIIATRSSKRVIKKKKPISEDDVGSDSDSSVEEKKPMKKRYKKAVSQSRKIYVKKSYLCTVCRKRTNDLSAYNRHITEHFRAGAKQCTQCARIFPNRSNLDRHITEDHSQPKTGNRLHEFLKARAKAKLEALKAKQRSAPRPRPQLPPPPPVEPLKMVLTKVAEPTYDVIMNGDIQLSGKHVKVTRVDGPITKSKVEDITVQTYVENFQPEEAPEKTGKNPVKLLTTNKHLKLRTVRSTIRNGMFRIFAKKFKEDKPTGKTGIAMPKRFTEGRREDVKVSIAQTEITEVRRKLDYGSHIEKGPADVYDADYFETENSNDDVAQVEVTSTPKKDAKKGYVMEVSIGQPSTLEMEDRLSEVCRKLEVDRNDLHIGHLTTSAPFFQIVNVKHVIKRQKKAEQEKKIKAKFKEIKIGGAEMVPVNPFAHLMKDRPVPDAPKSPPRVISVTTLPLNS